MRSNHFGRVAVFTIGLGLAVMIDPASSQPSARVTSQEVRRATQQLNALASSNKFVAAFNECATNGQLWEKAKADPIGFMKERRVVVPRNVDIRFEDESDARAARPLVPATNAARTRTCVRICVHTGEWHCVDICF